MIRRLVQIAGKILFFLQCVSYWVIIICSFDPFKIASDWSNISQIHHLVKTFDKKEKHL